MDKYTNRDIFPNPYFSGDGYTEYYDDPFIYVDAKGYGYIQYPNGDKHRYPYADTIIDPDNADDTGGTEHAAGEGDTDAEHAANNR